MLDDAEFELVLQASRAGMSVVEAERDRRNAPQLSPIQSQHASHETLLAILEMYRLLTGFEETVPGAVMHHRISLYGPECPSCKKRLRTASAKYCVACGFGQSEIADDPRPLVQRKPDLFK